MLPVTATGSVDNSAVQWLASAKCNGNAGTGSVTAYAINVLFKPPILNSLSAQQARVGDILTVVGDNFVHTMRVRFGMIEASATVAAVDTASTMVPQGLSGPVQVSVLVGDVASSPVTLNVIP